MHAREAPGAEQHSQPLLGGRPADEQELRRCAHRPCRVPGRFEPACSPEVVVDGLGSHVDVAGPACAYVGAHVRAVRDHGISRAVEVPQRQVAQHVGRAERVRPQRCPKDQRDPGAARPLPGGQGGQAPAGRADDRPVAAAAQEPLERERPHPSVRERQPARELASSVLEAPAEESHFDLLALVQPRQRAGAVGGNVAGDEQDRLHASALR